MTQQAKQGSLKLVPEQDEEIGAITKEGGYLIGPEQLRRLAKRLGHGTDDNPLKVGRRWLRILMADAGERAPLSGPTPKPACVRVADESDELDLFDMLVQAYREEGSNIYPLAPNRLIEKIQMGTQKKGGIIGVIDGPEGKPIAAVVLLPFQWPDSNAWYLREVNTYVYSDHRKSTHAKNLLLFARWCSEQWTLEFGYPVYLALGITTQNHLDAKTRFFKRFARQIGTQFLYPAPVPMV